VKTSASPDELSNLRVPKHTWRVSQRSDEGLSAFAALCLFALTFALMVGIRLAFSAVLAALRDLSMAEGQRLVSANLPALTLVQLLAMGTVIVVGLKLSDPDAPLREGLSLRPVRNLTLVLCLVAGACLQFPLAELANLLHQHVFGPEPLEQQLARQALLEAHSPLDGAIVVVCLVGLIPAAEELLFRGLLLFQLAHRYGPGFALLFSASLFGIIHLGAVPSVFAATAGLVLGAVALWTQSVWAGVALHAAVNAVPVLVPESVWPIHGFNVPSEQPEHLAPGLVLGLLTLAFCLLLWVRRLEGPRVSHD
jgi:membrane protease YdiL (CAAX protease family)